MHKINNSKLLISATARILTVFVFISIIGCSVDGNSGNGISETEDTQFQSLYENIDFDADLNLVLADVMVGNEFGQSVSFLLFNNSDHSIEFPVGLGPAILVYDERSASWGTVINEMEYYPPAEEILPPGEIPTGTTVLFKLPENKLPVEIRVAVVGEILQGGEPTGEMVGAYLDVVVGE